MLPDDPLWYKDAIIYELHVRAFHDSVGDGVGDFRGLTQKLDYLQDLGVTAIWLLPFYPSPLRDDGYDIADYTEHPSGIRHARRFSGVPATRPTSAACASSPSWSLNHTSDQHPWFQRARRAPPGSPERDFYVWSDTPEKYRDARIIFKDFEPSNWTWDRVAKAYYWHRFYSHQPDLNFDNPAVWEAIFPVVDFWLGMGVDGMRLDAVPYLFEREGTNCENLPETHDFLKALRRHIDEKFPNRMLLAEANQWPEDAVAYFGDGDECHMAFHFPLMPRLFMAIHMEDRFPIIDILDQTPAIPENCQWAMFLRNHDELTLEMVTDEERDYMYRAYAARSAGPHQPGHSPPPRAAAGQQPPPHRADERPAVLAARHAGDLLRRRDRHGRQHLSGRPQRRAHARCSGAATATPASRGPIRKSSICRSSSTPNTTTKPINVEAQQNNPNSLLWWMKRLIALRKRYQGLRPRHARVPASGQPQDPGLRPPLSTTSRFWSSPTCRGSCSTSSSTCRPARGYVPVELFGGTLFPRDRPSALSAHAGAARVLLVRAGAARAATDSRRGRRAGRADARAGAGHEARISAQPGPRADRAGAARATCKQTRWAGGPHDEIKSARFADMVRLPEHRRRRSFCRWSKPITSMARRGRYCLPTAVVSDERFAATSPASAASAARLAADRQRGRARGRRALRARMRRADRPPDCRPADHDRRAARRSSGTLFGSIDWPPRSRRRRRVHAPVVADHTTSTAVALADRLLLRDACGKWSRGFIPQVEIGRYLTHRKGFEHVAAAGRLARISPPRRRADDAGHLAPLRAERRHRLAIHAGRAEPVLRARAGPAARAAPAATAADYARRPGRRRNAAARARADRRAISTRPGCSASGRPSCTGRWAPTRSIRPLRPRTMTPLSQRRSINRCATCSSARCTI